jgi:DNA-binding response OmpR family regulator
MMPAENQRPTILLVDDTPVILSQLTGLLSEHYRIKVANNGLKAIKLAVSAQPDLVLLDVMMPIMDGYEVCRQLKANPLTCDIPVIFITAKSESEDEVLGLTLGAVDFLPKPIVPAILMARVSTHIALRRVSLELAQRNQILNDEKKLLEDIVTRMHSDAPFDSSKVRHIQKSLERTCGDIILSAYRPDGAQHVLVGDFSGHGLPASFAGPLVSYIFYSLTAAGHELPHILAELNRTLCRQLPTQLYMAASALELSSERNQARIWNYGVPPVLCLSEAHELVKIHSNGLPLGMCELTNELSDGDVPHALLQVGSSARIYQYTDGITEARSPAQEEFEQCSLDELVMRIFHEQLPLETIWEKLMLHSAGQGLTDDAVMVETSI